MANFTDQLGSNPQAKQLLENQKAIRQMLANPETRKVLQSLQKKNVSRLQAAAQAALQGIPPPLTGVLQELSADPPGRPGHGAAEPNHEPVTAPAPEKGGMSHGRL